MGRAEEILNLDSTEAQGSPSDEKLTAESRMRISRQGNSSRFLKYRFWTGICIYLLQTCPHDAYLERSTMPGKAARKFFIPPYFRLPTTTRKFKLLNRSDEADLPMSKKEGRPKYSFSKKRTSMLVVGGGDFLPLLGRRWEGWRSGRTRDDSYSALPEGELERKEGVQ